MKVKVFRISLQVSDLRLPWFLFYVGGHWLTLAFIIFRRRAYEMGVAGTETGIKRSSDKSNKAIIADACMATADGEAEL